MTIALSTVHILVDDRDAAVRDPAGNFLRIEQG